MGIYGAGCRTRTGNNLLIQRYEYAIVGKYLSHIPAESFDGILELGQDNLDTERRFNGFMDDVRVYNYAMTAEQIEAVCYGGGANLPVPEFYEVSADVNTNLQWTNGYRTRGFDGLFRNRQEFRKRRNNIFSGIYGCV